MTEPEQKRRKPRIRKAAPTVREQLEAVQAKKDHVKPQRVRKLAGPLGRVKLPRPKGGGGAAKIGRALVRPLKWLGLGYFLNSWREVRQVTWPTRRETWRLTLAVFIFAVIFGAVAYGVDKALDALFKNFVLK